MDSDLSLIEISGEDDSLLQPIPGGDGSSSFNNGGRIADGFLCSPLQVSRSNSKTTGIAVVHKENFNVESENKENFNVEKSETMKLSVEPLQMKRKRKGGGYNLRKSLAWDRAFFTEEGVLDDTELSMISGNFGNSKQALLPIQEEVGGNSSGLHTVQENLFKELPVATSDRTKRVGGNLFPRKRNNDAPTSVCYGKVLLNHDGNRSGLKRSACPRPVASSSTLKRSANLVATKASEKEPKVSKLPIQKPSPSALPSRIGKSSISSASDSKWSQVSRPARNTQKNFGPSSSTKSVRNTSKADLASKSLSTKTSLGQAKRNVMSSVKCSLTGEKLPLNSESKNSLEVDLNPSRPSTGLPSYFHDGRAGKIATPLSQNTQLAENQAAIPTGLRMPSPSLGFFGQSKTPSPSPLKMKSQTCNAPESNISSVRKLGIPSPAFAQKPPLAPRNLPTVTTDGTTIKNIKALDSSSGNSMSPALNLASHEMEDTNLEKTYVLKVENKLKNSEQSNEAIKENELRGTLDGVDQPSHKNVGQCATKETLDVEGVKVLRSEESLLHRQLYMNDIGAKVVDCSAKGSYGSESENLPLSGSIVEITDSCEEVGTVDLKLEEDEPFSLSLKDRGFAPQFTSGTSNVQQLSGELEVNPSADETAPTSGDTQMLRKENVADASPQLVSTELEKVDTIAPGKVKAKSNMEDLEVKSIDDDITGNRSNSYSGITVDIQNQVMVDDVTEKPVQEEFPEPLLPRGHALPDRDIMHVDDCLLGGKSFSTEEAKQGNGAPSDEPASRDICRSELKSSSEPSALPVTLPDGGSDMAKLVECQNQEDTQSLSIDGKPVTENYSPYNQFQHDTGIHNETSLMELGNVEGHVAVVGTSEDVNVTSQNSVQETSNIVSAPSLVLLLEGDASIEHTIEHVDAEEKRPNSSVVSPCCNSDQPEDNLCPDHDDNTVGQICGLGGEDEVNEHREDQEKQRIPCFGEIDMSCEARQCPEMDCLVFQGIHSLDEHHKFETGTNTNVYAEVTNHEGSGSENLSTPVPEKMNQVIEEQDENSEFQYLGVGLGPMSQENCRLEVYPSDCETDKINHESMESEATRLHIAGFSDVTHENSPIVPRGENDRESILELSYPCQREAKITCTQVKTLPDDDHGKTKEAEPSKVEVAATRKLEIQSSVKDVEVKANSSKSDLQAKQTDKDAKTEQKKTGIDKKQDLLVIKPPANVVPFSDEWLAAIEAAGEEILTMKSGAVQNSPQDRSQPVPGPWSPVKRKQYQTLGPFDCTKHTNH